MRVALTIVELPGFDDSLSLGHLGEPVHIQAFIAQSVIIRLNEGIIHRFAGSNEVELQTSPIGSIFQRL